MKTTRLLVLAISILLVLNGSVCPLFAKAPTTPKILFTSAAWDGNYEIYIMNPDGSEQVNLTQHRANDVGAVWSPTGEQILFVSDRGGNRVVTDRDLYLMDPDGSNVRRVFKREAGRLDSTWSPDGERIAYEYVDWGTRKTTIQIAILGEQEEEPIMKGFYPAWSPDGTEIAYTTYLEGIGMPGELHLSTYAQERKNYFYPRKQWIGKTIPLGHPLVTNSFFLGTRIRYRRITIHWLMLSRRHGRLRRQFILSTATAPISNNLLMKPVPRHSILGYRRMGKKFSIHRMLIVLCKSSNSI